MRPASSAPTRTCRRPSTALPTGRIRPQRGWHAHGRGGEHFERVWIDRGMSLEDGVKLLMVSFDVVPVNDAPVAANAATSITA